MQGKFERPLPSAMGHALSQLPGVEFVNPLRMVRHSLGGQLFYLVSFDLPNYSRHDELPVVDGDLSVTLREIASGVGVAASESFVRAFRIGPGDLVRLQTPDGPRDFRISLVYVDYSAELGILTTTREVYTRVWRHLGRLVQPLLEQGNAGRASA